MTQHIDACSHNPEKRYHQLIKTNVKYFGRIETQKLNRKWSENFDTKTILLSFSVF